MLINYATSFDSKDIHLWSGLGYYIGKMLENEGHDVNYLNHLHLRNQYIHKLRKQVMYRLFRKSYSPNLSLRVARQYCRDIEREVPEGSLIFSPNTILLSQLNRTYRKVLFTDATFRLLLDFYPAFSNIPPRYIDEAETIERQALRSSELLIYSSRWAAQSAINHYDVDPAKIAIVPFGANMDVRMDPAEHDGLICNRINQQVLQLLLIGVSWYRKGGDYALQVVDALNRAGVPARLHIAGMRQLPANIDRRYIINHGYISKGTREGQQRIAELMKKANFLLIPSRADCTPVAVSEANSFGLPCLLSDVGGNHAVISNGLNGSTFDFTAGPEECVDFIRRLKFNPDRYAKMCRDSYDRYQNELNWNTSGKTITRLLEELLNGQRKKRVISTNSKEMEA